MERRTNRGIVKGSLKAIAKITTNSDSLSNTTLTYIDQLEDLIKDMYLKTWPYLRDEGLLELVEGRMDRLGLMEEED